MEKTRAERRRAQQKAQKSGSRPDLSGQLKAWWTSFREGKSPVFIFLLRFLGVIVPFYLIWWMDFFKDHLIKPWNSLNAALAGVILNLFGAETTADGVILSSGEASISIMEGCDGIEPIMLFVAGVVAFPIEFNLKWKALLYGSLFLVLLNFIRILTLFVAAQNWPEGFDFLHVEFWQTFFILLAILMWTLWISRLPKPSPAENA